MTPKCIQFSGKLYANPLQCEQLSSVRYAEVKYAGLLLLLLGLAGFFYLWLSSISRRTKVVESDTPQAPSSAIAHRFGPPSFELVPQAPAAKPKAEDSAVLETVQVAAASPESVTEEEAQCETALTHIEIAGQFFDMGDFEGAAEMCQLVMENPKASPDQREAAVRLRELCI